MKTSKPSGFDLIKIKLFLLKFTIFIVYYIEEIIMKYKDKIVIQTYVPTDTYEKLLKNAEKEKRSLSSYIRIVLEDVIHRNEESSNENLQRINN